MFKTMMPTGSGFAYIFGPDVDDSPVLIQRLPSVGDSMGQVVNVIPTDGGMTHQAFVIPLFDGIESL